MENKKLRDNKDGVRRPDPIWVNYHGAVKDDHIIIDTTKKTLGDGVLLLVWVYTPAGLRTDFKNDHWFVAAKASDFPTVC